MVYTVYTTIQYISRYWGVCCTVSLSVRELWWRKNPFLHCISSICELWWRHFSTVAVPYVSCGGGNIHLVCLPPHNANQLVLYKLLPLISVFSSLASGKRWYDCNRAARGEMGQPLSVSWCAAGSEVVNGGTTQLQDVPILGIYQTPNEGTHYVCTCTCMDST